MQENALNLDEKLKGKNEMPPNQLNRLQISNESSRAKLENSSDSRSNQRIHLGFKLVSTLLISQKDDPTKQSLRIER